MDAPGLSNANQRPSSFYIDEGQEFPIDLSRILLKDILQATNNFAEENIIEKDYCWIVYKGELSGKKLAFVLFNEGYKLNDTGVNTIRSLPEHQNVVPFIGCCDEDDKMILVLEHLTRGGLDKYVSSAHLTWLMRLQICLDIACGLQYLQNHSQIEELNSKCIHLDENWQAKIQLITPSALTDPNGDISFWGIHRHLDPLYSFGVILFELLCGRLEVTEDEDERFNGTLTKLVDPILRVQMNRDAFTVFSEIAYACLDENEDKRPTISQVVEELQKVLRLQGGFETSELQQLSYCNFLNVISYICLEEKQVKRPTISTVVEELQKVLKLQQGFQIPELQQVKTIQHMKISLEEIRSATRDFHDDYTIPHGTGGKVYKADLYHFNVDKYVAENKIKRVSMKEILEYPRRKSTIAIKSIDGRYGQRTEEQLQTLLYLSHENLVKLVGFCDEDDERIHVVYEYASNGSLHEYIHRQHINYHKYYITNPTGMRNIFPWVIRLQFCLDAARGLKFLHDGSGKNDTIIHGNIKSSNILISRDGVGMIGNFGLSTNQYSDTHRLTKEYDVYSFGLVLFEVLSGVLTPSKISEDDPKFLPAKVKRGFNQGDLNDIIDPMLKKEFDTYHDSLIGDRSAESLNIFVNIACRCFHEEEDPPTMADIVKELEKAYRIHVESLEKRQKGEDNAKVEKLKHLKIPFTEIFSATKGFDDCMIGWGGFGGVYTAELFHVDVRKYIGMKESLVELYGYSRRKGKVALKRREIMSGQGRNEFWKEIDVLSGLNHQNIISLVGFCYEYGEMIIIYDYASNGSFDRYIQNKQNLKWEKRLQICIDAAQGLNYLHNHHIIHRDVKSPNILLGDSLEGMIGDVGLSITVKNTDSQLSNINAAGTGGYVDPKYLEDGTLSKQSDMYSFGVVLLEVLRGEFVRSPAKDKFRAILVEKAEQYLTSNEPSQIIGDDHLRKDLNNGKFLDSVKTFAAITHECLHSTDGDETHRLTMADVLKGLKKALTVHSVGSEPFSLEDIKSATNHFSKERVIGGGRSGKIYKGELLFSKKRIPVAVKRLDRARSYEEGAFLKEVVKLCGYVHENIITLRGFCEEGNEKIIIMDHAINGSLDKHLHKSTLTWGLRLEISIGAAKGLEYIHSFKEDQKTVHGDIKSSNILLDHDWKAIISDFIISKNHGTLGYLDPQYSSSRATKASDVYSFGVVLFELLSGRLAIERVEKYSHPTLRQIIDEHCFEEKKLEALIFDDMKEQTDAKSIDILSQVAYECLQKDKKRPKMALVIQELEKALNVHDEWEWERKVPKDYEKIIKMSQHPVSRKITKKELYSLFSSGILLQNRKVLSLSKEGKVKEMISATMFSYKNLRSLKWRSTNKSRFQKVAKISDTSNLNIQIQINSQFSSLGIIYGVYLVFKFCDPKRDSSEPYVKLKYRTASRTLTSYVAERRDDEWMMIELCRFRNHDQVIDFEVLLKSFSGRSCGSGPIYVDGIEFRPIDNGDRALRLINADSIVNWDQQSTSDFHEIMKRSQYDVLTMTKQELYELLITGILIDNGEKLFSLSKVNCKKCHMLPPKAVINKSSDTNYSKCQSSATSRFGEVVELQRCQAFILKCDIETQVLSPDTAYVCYLAFQLPENCKGLKCPLKVRDLLNKNNKETTVIYLKAPGPIDLYRDKRVPENRDDGWMEVRVWDFVYNKEHKGNCIPMELKLVCLGGTMSGLIICGVEFRPLLNKRLKD